MTQSHSPRAGARPGASVTYDNGRRGRVLPRPKFGCVVVRRVTDDQGREWRAREFCSAGGLGLFFRCEVPGVPPVVRAAHCSLEALSDDELVAGLQAGVE